MATFTDAQLGKITQAMVRDLRDRQGITDVPFSRPKVWAAYQAIRAVLDSAALRTSVSDAIDTAIAPETMTAAQKKRVFGRVIETLVSGEVA